MKVANTKTIKAPGSSMERVAQACDRCRAKKVKCDGKKPCSNCASTGLNCIVSDKLSRRAFPKGYTETLEERIRQLELENVKLVGLLDARDEQIKLLNKSSLSTSNDLIHGDDPVPTTKPNVSQVLETHLHEKGCPCGCLTDPHAVHERPVSIAGSIYDGGAGGLGGGLGGNFFDQPDLARDDTESLASIEVNSFDLKDGTPAPGAFAAATAIAQMQKTSLGNHEANRQMLTRLVAASIPRSTEETLFIPTLLARICQVYGYNSQAAILASNAIASLKENSSEFAKPETYLRISNELLMKIILNRHNVTRLEESEASYFIQNIHLPSSRIELDLLTTVYFQEWGSVLPILDKNAFLASYIRLTDFLDKNDLSFMAGTLENLSSAEKLGATMVLVLALALLTETRKNPLGNSKYVSYLNHYDFLIHEFVKPNCIITQFSLIQSLQILTLALQYCLAIGDITTCYELRGRVITMAQQLRLHRCPAAVLGVSGVDGDVNLKNYMQGERRILFWCIYCLDTYLSLNLGVPRLLKDFEIECALPFSGKHSDDNDDDNENILIINNTKLSIVGKVSRFSLSIMLYCKALGDLLDTIFSRFDATKTTEISLEKERILESWRRNLPDDLKLDVDGVSGDNFSTDWNKYSKQQLMLVFLYYHAKILIYLPIISKYGNHYNVGLSTKEQLTKGQSNNTSIMTSISMIQQSSSQILQVLNTKSNYLLPIPLNVVREQSRLSLLVARGTLDYMKGGSLYQSLKQLLMDTISNLSTVSSQDTPGSMTPNSVKLLELALLSVLGLNVNKNLLSLKKKQKNIPDPYKPEPYDSNAKIDGLNKHADFVQDPELELDSTDFANLGLDESLFSTEGLENIFEFDPLKVNFNKQQMMQEFAADGSLGLVPFLEMSDKNFP